MFIIFKEILNLYKFICSILWIFYKVSDRTYGFNGWIWHIFVWFKLLERWNVNHSYNWENWIENINIIMNIVRFINWRNKDKFFSHYNIITRFFTVYFNTFIPNLNLSFKQTIISLIIFLVLSPSYILWIKWTN